MGNAIGTGNDVEAMILLCVTNTRGSPLASSVIPTCKATARIALMSGESGIESIAKVSLRLITCILCVLTNEPKCIV